MNSTKKELALALHEIGAIKFGEYQLKSGIISPFYIDLRIIVSYPIIMKIIVDLIVEKARSLQYDLITGIPYTALPIAALVSQETNTPLIYQRKEIKTYGTAQKIEGVYLKNQSCLVIDDVMTTGESKFETAIALENAGLAIKDFIIVVDRSRNGSEELRKKGYDLHTILNIKELINILVTENKITNQQATAVLDFVVSTEPKSKINRLSETSNFSDNIKTK